MFIALITIQGQDFGYDWMADGVTVGGSNLSTFVRNIFVGLFIGWGAFIASHQDLIYYSYKQKLLWNHQTFEVLGLQGSFLGICWDCLFLVELNLDTKYRHFLDRVI